MVTTKQKILNKALELFNQNGITAVSLRSIANNLDMSIGNLQYHFKKREDIVEKLYLQLVDQLNQVTRINPENIIQYVFTKAKEIFRHLYAYRFFLLDFVAITRNNSTIKKHYAALSQYREKQFLEIVNMLIQQGLFRPEQLKDEYKNLHKRIEVISNFWLSSELIQSDNLSEKVVDSYATIINYSIYPYLTKKGKEAFLHSFEYRQIG